MVPENAHRPTAGECWSHIQQAELGEEVAREIEQTRGEILFLISSIQNHYLNKEERIQSKGIRKIWRKQCSALNTWTLCWNWIRRAKNITGRLRGVGKIHWWPSGEEDVS